MDAGRPALDGLREVVPRVVGAVARRCRDFGAAEDAVQEALMAAAEDWPQRGAPDNPAGWLFHVACRRLSDSQEAEAARRRREAASALSPDAAAPAAAVSGSGSGAGSAGGRAREPDEPFAEEDDDTLLLLFLCCHPALSPASAVALTLRAVGGLTTAEIAAAFLVPEATMAQRISRAKQSIREAGARFELPDEVERERRLAAVRQVLYLLFNEGYLPQAGVGLTRVELSGEAIRLARMLDRHAPGDPETAGLLSLMLLTDARRAARTGPAGELIPLHEQDRAAWDRAAIAEGTERLQAALKLGRAGAFQVQAAIAVLHDEAPSVEATDWRQILGLYDVLATMGDHPLVTLNRAVAVAMVHGVQAGLEELAKAEAGGRLGAQAYRAHAVRGHLLERSGEREAAAREFEAAANATGNPAERDYLERKAAGARGLRAPAE
jgi:RNA polymerase sigma factor (sigma-70 family)